MREKKVFGLTDEQKKRVLKVRARNWDKPISMWKKMRLNKGQISFTGKREIVNLIFNLDYSIIIL